MTRLSTTQTILVVFSLLLAGLVGFGATTTAVDFSAYNPAWDGSSYFRSLAKAEAETSTVVFDASAYRTTPANGTLAIVLSPTSAYDESEIRQIREFVRAGGTLVVAEDFGPHSNELLAGVGAESRIDGHLYRDNVENYRSASFPVVPNVSDHELLPVGQLTMNYGTVLDPGGAKVLVRTSPYGYLDRNRDGRLNTNETLASYPVVTIESVGSGSVLVVSDSSIFINAMLERPGNRLFAMTLLSSYERILLDYSHSAGTPLFAIPYTKLQSNSFYQVLVGVAAVLLIALWGREEVRTGRLLSSSTNRDEFTVDSEYLVNVLSRRHPEWSDERTQRLAQILIRHRRELFPEDGSEDTSSKD